jgi:hemerythrin
MITLLQKIVKRKPQKKDAEEKLKECINMGLKHFKEDRYFMQLFQGHFNNN